MIRHKKAKIALVILLSATYAFLSYVYFFEPMTRLLDEIGCD